MSTSEYMFKLKVENPLFERHMAHFVMVMIELAKTNCFFRGCLGANGKRRINVCYKAEINPSD